MQARAIIRAAHAVRERTGLAPRMEIMIPLVAYARELEMANVVSQIVELVIRTTMSVGSTIRAEPRLRVRS